MWSKEIEQKAIILNEIFAHRFNELYENEHSTNLLNTALRLLAKSINISNLESEDESENEALDFLDAKKSLFESMLKLDLWDNDHSFPDFKNNFVEILEDYQDSDEFIALIKSDQVDVYVAIFNAKVWLHSDALKNKLLTRVNTYVTKLPKTLQSFNKDEIDVTRDEEPTNLWTPFDLQDDTYLITAILDSGFWQERYHPEPKRLCALCLALMKHETIGDLLSPLLQSKLFEHNTELARKTAALAMTQFDFFVSQGVPHLPRAQASLATRVINSGLWQFSDDELIRKLGEACSAAIAGMEADPIEDDEDTHLEMVGDPIASGDGERIAALLQSIIDSGICQFSPTLQHLVTAQTMQ